MTRALPDRPPAPPVPSQAKRPPCPGAPWGLAWRRLGATLAFAATAPLAAAAAVAGGSPAGRTGAAGKPAPVPPPSFDEATAAAWKKARADVGWMEVTKYGFVKFRVQPDDPAAAVPAFRIRSEGLPANLP